MLRAICPPVIATQRCNIALICSVVVLCAAVIGCSSSDDGKLAGLERQLDVEKAARVMAEQERDAAEQARIDARVALEAAGKIRERQLDMEKAARVMAEQERDAAEQARIDARVALAAADKIRDAAAYGVEKVNRVGDTILIRKSPDWDSDYELAGWRFHHQTNHSGSKYTSMSQSYRDGSLGIALPWYDEDGNLSIVAGIALAYRPLQSDPDLWPFRAIDSHHPIDNHGLGVAWQGVEAMKTYEGGGTLTLRLFTDLMQSDNPGDPFTTHPSGDATYPNIVLDDLPAIPAGWDGLWIYAGGLRGSLDSAAGTFSCAAGEAGYCGLEDSRDNLPPGYTPDVGGDPVIFTPDDGSGDVMLAHPQPAEVPTVNYLTLGSWLFVPEDVTNLDAYDFGVFAGGDDPFMVDNLQGLAGTADYAGEAAGTYADVPAATISPFNAKVELTADFGTPSDFGTIEGRVYEFEIDGRETSPLTELDLTVSGREDGTTNIFQSSAGGSPVRGGWVDGNAFGDDTATTRWRGSWGGKFFGNGHAASDIPSAFAGTFGATDGDHTFAGSFGARQQ